MNKNIGLYNLEPKIYNSALMQISQYHKQQGDIVYHYHPLFHDKYDKIYASSLFNFTSKKYVTKDMICGGTGFNIGSKLPKEIEDCDLDYSFQPDCDFSMIWFSRGCFRNCPFCVVNQKEGGIHPVEPKNLNPNGKYIKIMDNNFFGNPKWRDSIDKLHEWNQPVDIQGLDVRIFDDEQGEALQSLTLYKNRYVKFGWDNPRENLIPKIKHLIEYIHHRKIIAYIIIGFWSTMEEDYKRIRYLWDNLGIDSFVMPYDKSNYAQRHFARWCNNKWNFKTLDWNEYVDINNINKELKINVDK